MQNQIAATSAEIALLPKGVKSIGSDGNKKTRFQNTDQPAVTLAT